MQPFLIRGLFCPVMALVVVLFSQQVGLAQTNSVRWRWSNPAPHGNHIYDAATFFGLTIQVCDRGQIFSSDDLVEWEVHESKTTNALRGLAFLGNRAVFTGERGTVLYADSLADIQPGTLTTGATADWLESVAANPFMAVAVGDNGAIYTTTNGVQWARQASGPIGSTWLRSVAFGSGRFVAVGENGLIATSPNGTNWTTRSSGTTNHLNRVSFNNSRFWALGDKGTMRFSTDAGITWLTENSGATNNLNGIASFMSGAGSTNFVVVGDGEVRAAQGFGPPLSWANQLDPARTNRPPNWTYYNAVSQGNFVLLSGRSGMVVEGYRTNSNYFWFTPETYRNWLWDITSAPDFYVAVGDFATVMTSNNGLDWSLELVPAALTNTILLGVGGSTNGLVAVGNKGKIIYSPPGFTNIVTTNGTTVTTNTVSTLGAIWKEVASPVTNDLQGVALFNNTYIVSGANGTILTSPNGTNWTVRTAPTTNYLSSVTWFSNATVNLAVATGNKGIILSSTNGINWTAQFSGTTNWIYKVRTLGPRMVAVGENGVIFTSSNGASWNLRASGTTAWLYDVALITNSAAQTHYAVGREGTVLISTNVINWSSLGSATTKGLYAAAGRGTQLVAAGFEGSILRLPTEPIMDPIRFVSFSQVAGQNLFLISAKADQRFTVDPSSNLVNWVTGPSFEVLNSSGTLLYAEPIVSNAPPAQFYRGTVLP